MSGLWASGDVLSLARLNQKTIFMGTSAPTSTYAGQIWFDTSSDIMKVYDTKNQSAWAFAPLYQVIVAQATADNAPYTQTTETAMTHCVYTFAANALQVGQVIILEAWGYQTSSGSASTARFYIRWGAATSGTILADTGAVAVNSLASALVYIKFIMTVITIGSSGTVWCQGYILWGSNTALTTRGLGPVAGGTGAANAAVVTINTTVQTTLTLSFVYGTSVSGNTMAISNCTLLI